MKNLHPARKRLLIGCLLLAATFFYAFAPTCGVVGQLIARASGYLIGQTGSTLLALTMFVVGLLLVFPHGTVGSIVRWAFHGREARVARVVREMDDHVARRRAERSAVVVEEVEPEKVESVKTGKLAPTDRKNLDAVRCALKDLGYVKHEYEPLIAKMDGKLGFETLVKGALKDLRQPQAN